jgi:hypothetical protein
MLTASLLSCSLAALAPNPFEGWPDSCHPNRIDELVSAKWAALGIEPAQLCSDGVFVRRVYLDLLGTLPTGHEAQEFLLDTNPDKRRVLIDRLLEREEYADYWAMKWGECLRIKAEFPINLWPNAAQAYHRWIHTAIKDNWGYDRIARELLTSSGSNFRVPPVNFYRAVQSKDASGLAQAAALTFMGVRTDRWPREQLVALAAFFAKVGFKSTGEWKEEIVYFDPNKTNVPSAGPSPPRELAFPDGTRATVGPNEDPRERFADWLIRPTNPWFTQNIANRVWAWLLGRGIIHEPDDLRPDNPPSNPELLKYLETELIRARYDLQQLYRLILNSRAYQLAPIPRSEKAEAMAQFAFCPLRRVEAEVLIDALNQITGTSEKYSSAIPEPFTVFPESYRAVALPDASLTSAFLEMFGRPPRDTGLQSERNNQLTSAQRLHLLNSTHILRKIEQSRMIQFQTRAGQKPRAVANGIYLGVVSRFPTESEIQLFEQYAQGDGMRLRAAAVDLSWALINGAEFLYRH